MTQWRKLIGQPQAIETLRAAVADAARQPAGPAMTHAWLVTGPPGSGRSVAAELFASALMCSTGGCGECPDCRDVAKGAHPDLTVITPDGLSYRTSDARLLAERAAYSPTRSRWHVIVLEDADRLTESANNVLLKSIEEPPPRTVWVLCAPSSEDVLPTIHSRCRQIRLRTPSSTEVAAYLSEIDGVDPQTALFAARAAQGHVGRARALAVEEEVRRQRQLVLGVPRRLTDVVACLSVAAELVGLAKEAAENTTTARDQREREELSAVWGEGAQGKGVRGGARGHKGA
ncbi:MAG: DNA polymerase III subunit delta', partial [Candidatus Nanopelagicales bacterium]|nr:DNA polymerase III subunit delta' [Candidatus Nanopelagicales bacterium]